MTAQATAGKVPLGFGGAATRAGSVPAIDGTTAMPRSRTQREVFWQSFRDHRAAYVSLWIVVALAAACVLLPFVLPWTPTKSDPSLMAAAAPSVSHPLGTDQLGRDVLSRLMAAGRISLMVGLMVALISAAIGSAVGICAAYFGGKVDEGLMWLVNVLMTVPQLPLLMAMGAVAQSADTPAAKVLGGIPPQWRIIVVMSLLGWTGISRVVRSQVLSLRRQEFVEAATALGSSHWRVMATHILPNAMSVLAVFTTLALSTAIMTESGLSFFGLGVTPPTPTWGNMLNEARDVFTVVQYWWLTWAPALAIFATVLCVNFVGDGMRDAFDPKSASR